MEELKEIIRLLTEIRDLLGKQTSLAERAMKQAGQSANIIDSIFQMVPPEARKQMEPLLALITGGRQDGK